jgi:GNAT superfamily N-acetyltransferase
MSVEFRPMRDDEFRLWLPRMRDAYADEMRRSGRLSAEAARTKAERETEQLFPGGKPSAEQAVFVIEEDGEPVGELWVAERDGEFGRVLWIYDIHVRGERRGRGLGKTAMSFAEDEARRRGVGRVALNVFGRNEVARGLYRSLGYAEVAVVMDKDV